YYNKDYHYEIYLSNESGKNYLVLSKKVHDIEHIEKKIEIDFKGEIEFQIITGKEDYLFSYRLEEDWIPLGSAKTAGLCTEGTMKMTFTGTYLGVFASNVDAYFEYFSAKEI
ncbi:MAG: glycoside hydrolase family 43 protein, partial [Halanaerobiales bacterium]